MNKTIVVTGASRGIGRAIALLFANKGFDVAVCARSEKDLNALAETLQAAAPSPIKVIAEVCDVSDKAQIIKFGQKVLAEFSQVDVLVNNAGVFLPGQVINEEEGTLEKLINTNLYSAYRITRQLAPKMIAQKSGHIFNVSSVAGIQAYNNGGSYSISKFAMRGLSMALREELKPHNVRVTTLLPGATLTDSWAGVDLPESRFMQADDVAQTIWDIYHLPPTTVIEELILRPQLGDI
jgi:NADP-dependent 3-hydroxy acid dehydrogenase YdfG